MNDDFQKVDDDHSQVGLAVKRNATDIASSQQQVRNKSMWKRMRKGTKKTFKKFKKNQEKRMWGENAEVYNTVGSTIFFCNFQFLQLTRLISTLVLMFCVFIFFYIYVKAAVFHYIFVSLFVTFLAFGFIFIGSGKQVVYQKLVNEGKIDYGDPKKRSNLWRIGVLLYGIAIPLVITSNFIYFVPLKSFSGMFSAAYLKTHPLLDVTNQSLQDDINETIEIYYSRIYKGYGKENWDQTGWRQNFVMWSNIIPAICLGVDFMMNKVHIRFFQIKFTVLINMMYFLISCVLQAAMKKPMYVDNLNWFCDINQSFLYSEENGQKQMIIHKHLIETTCEYWEKNTSAKSRDGIHCEPLTNNYYCGSKAEIKADDITGLINSGAHPYSVWKNCWLFVVVVMIVSTLSFCLSYGLHRAKLCGAKAYKCKEEKFEGETELSEQGSKDNRINVSNIKAPLLNVESSKDK